MTRPRSSPSVAGAAWFGPLLRASKGPSKLARYFLRDGG
jgi:hypothetical protein